jgi:4-amino-4-deoxy-L-arabinose transferase-like glycosyltransferase
MMTSIKTIKEDQRIWIIAIIVIAIVGVGAMMYYTRTGAGVRGDSVRYVMLARNMLEGKGYSRISGGGEIYPETGFAPFFSVVLSILGIFGGDLFAAGRFLNLALFGTNIFLAAYLLLRSTRSGGAALIGAGLFIAADNIFTWHAWLMSEPLFIFLTLVTLLALLEYVMRDRVPWLLLAALTTAAASLTRYVGVSLIPTGGIVILLLSKGDIKRRLARSILFGILSAVPFLLWFMRNQSLGVEGIANRELIFHPIRPEVLRVYLFEMASWFLPEQIVVHRLLRAIFAVLTSLIAPIFFVYALLQRRFWRSRSSVKPLDVLNIALLLLVPFYVLILAINSFLLDAATTYSGIIRYATPLYVFVLLLEIGCVVHVFRSFGTLVAARAAAVVFALVLLVFAVFQTFPIVLSSTLDLGFTGIRDRWPRVVQELTEHDPSIPIISNNPEMVYYLVDRPAYMKPIHYDPYQQAYREDFEEQIELARSRLASGSIFVFFDEPSDEEGEILKMLDAAPILSTSRVTIYAYPEAQ